MKLSSSSRHRLFGFLAISIGQWPAVVLGKEDFHLRRGAITKYTNQQEDEPTAVVRDIPDSHLSDHSSHQQDENTGWNPPALVNLELMSEMDIQTSTLADILRKQATQEDENRLCAWGLNALGGTLTYTSQTNIAFPSLDSNYWVTPILVQDLANTTIKITGRAPNARYYSFQTYVLEDKFSTTIGALKDVDIVFDDDGTFTIFVTNGEDPRQVNSLRGLPAGVNDGIVVLMYRTYEPKPFASPAGGVKLPSIAVERMGGKLRTMEYCDDPEPIIQIEEPVEFKTIVQFPQLPPNPAWFRTVGAITPFPNEDVAYLATVTGIFPVTGHAVVVRGKAPTFPNGVEKDPQVRYWSLCKLSIPSTKTVSCLQDEEVALDAEGRYVIVVAPERPSGTGFDYLNFGPGPLGSLAFRHMLPSHEFFSKSVQNIKNGDAQYAIRRKMGEYFPDTVYCPIATIEKQGVEKCFGGWN